MAAFRPGHEIFLAAQFPGLGAILSATGVPMGHFIAQALAEKVGEDGNPWTAWNSVVSDPKKHLAPELARHLDATISKSWQKLPAERRAFLELLSRIDLTADQAAFVAIPEERTEAGVTLTDQAFLGNPYLTQTVPATIYVLHLPT